MSNIISSIYNIRYLDELSSKKTIIHELNPVAKLIVTLAYLITVLSFDKYNIIGLLPYVFYPVFIFILSETPFLEVLKRMLVVLPFIIGIGIFNPLMDTKALVSAAGFSISGGWISFASLVIKCSLTVTAGLLLISTTGIEKIAAALRKLRVPKIFVTQLLLTYRYISVLLEEVGRVVKAYHLRAPMEKSISLKHSGSLLGQMLLRVFDRSNRVYSAMILRGFNGEYHFRSCSKFSFGSALYLLLWLSFFITAKFFNIPQIIGRILTGVMI